MSLALGLGLNISLVLNKAQAQKVTTVQELFGLNDSAQQKLCWYQELGLLVKASDVKVALPGAQ